jgi:hypothetical protein
MFHKEGYKIIFISLVSFVAAIILIDEITASIPWLRMTLMLVVLFFFVMILQFFRNPKRTVALNENQIIAPVDGKVVVIEDAKILIPNKDHFNFTESSRVIKANTILQGDAKYIRGKRRGEDFLYRLFATSDNKIIYLNKVSLLVIHSLLHSIITTSHI